MSTNNGASGLSSNKDILDNYVNALNIKIDIAKSQLEAAEIGFTAQKTAEQYGKCCLITAEKTVTFYRILDNCVVSGTQTDNELIKGRIAEAVKKSEDLSKLLKEKSKLFKDLKTTVAEIKKKACGLKDCLDEEQRCNSDVHAELVNGVANLDKDCSEIETAAADLSETTKFTYGVWVDFVGMFKFLGVNSLQEFCERLKVLIDTMKANIVENIKFAGQQVGEAQKKLSEIIKKLMIAKFNYYATGADGKGLDCIHQELCDHLDGYPNSKKVCDKTPEEINTEFMKLCTKIITDNFGKGSTNS